MKWRLLAVGALGFAACGPQTDGSADEIPADVEAQVARIGETAANALRTGLSQRLTAAIAEGGAEAAIDVCALEAMPLTDSIASATGAAELRRTSLRVRNPRNAPDAQDSAALHWFAELDAQEPRPVHLVQRDGEAYRYYSPLRIAPLCTQCHGPEETLSEPVRAALRQRYPDDRATGYAEGELRGLIRVTMPRRAVNATQ
jgi:hypothetical protein